MIEDHVREEYTLQSDGSTSFVSYDARKQSAVMAPRHPFFEAVVAAESVAARFMPFPIMKTSRAWSARDPPPPWLKTAFSPHKASASMFNVLKLVL